MFVLQMTIKDKKNYKRTKLIDLYIGLDNTRYFIQSNRYISLNRTA